MTKPTAVGGDPPVENECLPLDDISNFTTRGFGVAATIETTVCGGSGSMYFDIAILDTVWLFRMTLRGSKISCCFCWHELDLRPQSAFVG